VRVLLGLLKGAIIGAGLGFGFTQMGASAQHGFMQYLLYAVIGALRLAAAFSHSFEARVTLEEGRRLIVNPLDPRITEPTGAGVYESSRVQVIFEAQVEW
jgi:hypothetical protein